MELVILLVVAFLTVYFFLKRRRQSFDASGVKYLKPYPIFGNIAGTVVGEKHIADLIKEVYYKFPKERYVGFFKFNKPSVVLKDPDLIKQVMVKDFDHFTDHITIFNADTDPAFANNLFLMKGSKWHSMRGSLSPAFTSARMRDMFPFIEKCSDRLVTYLHQEIEASAKQGKDYFEIEGRNILTRCVSDIIATCAFGVEEDSLNLQDNQFYKMAFDLGQFRGRQVLKMIALMFCPELLTFLNIPFFKREAKDFFSDLILRIIKYREETGLVRQDMLQLLMQARRDAQKKVSDDKGSNKNNYVWTDDDMVSQCNVFLLAGFETTATTMSFLMSELVANPECQTKVQQEIDNYIKDNGPRISYNDIGKLVYLDMAISESLRLWVPVPTLDRVCTKAYTFPKPNVDGKPLTIYPGTEVLIPATTIHRDPKFFPDPEVFNPERFSDSNKAAITAGTYMPFGNGPRICIGTRFALMQVKMLLFYLLASFDLVKVPRTEYPPKILKHVFIMTAENGFWLGVKKRDKKN